MDGENDHVHLLVEYPPKMAVFALVNSPKGVSSQLLRRDRPDLAARLLARGAVVAKLLCRLVRQYIEQQETPD
jgi:putative transposase